MEKNKNNNMIMSIDAETNGLWGQAFSIGLCLEDGTNWIGRCPIEGEIDPWVKENVIPVMRSIELTHDSYDEMLKDFVKFYYKHKEGRTIIVHMGLPVESKLFIDAHEKGYLGDWDAPYPLVDISAIPAINTSVDTYNVKNNIEVPEFTGGTHNPLYDAAAAMLAYNHWLEQQQ